MYTALLKKRLELSFTCKTYKKLPNCMYLYILGIKSRATTLHEID